MLQRRQTRDRNPKIDLMCFEHFGWHNAVGFELLRVSVSQLKCGKVTPSAIIGQHSEHKKTQDRFPLKKIWREQKMSVTFKISRSYAPQILPFFAMQKQIGVLASKPVVGSHTWKNWVERFCWAGWITASKTGHKKIVLLFEGGFLGVFFWCV